MAVQFGIILALIAKQGLQAAIKKYGRSAVSKATSKAARDAAKKSTKIKNKEVLKQLEKKKIEEKASENILKRQMEKEQVEGTVKSAAERRASYASPRQAQKSRDTLKEKGREKRLEKERQSRGDLDDAFIEEGERFPDKFTTSEGNPISLSFAEGGEAMTDTNTWEKTSIEKKKRYGMQEGGDIKEQMNMLMPETEMMVEEPADQAMVSDEQMEDEYLDFIIDQSLSPEEETSLMSKLEADPELSVMFDKVMDTATEFAGAGPVEGPGSGVSDSIPARLSDGEFVFTAKATEQIGADRLQSMMDDAEAEADVMRQQNAEGGKIEEEPKVDRFGKPVDEDIAEDEIRKGMMSVNPRLQ